ncbi:MAG TPA: hypothetical protein VMX97_11130 [Hyphomicrobiaceae bacterium]|nr:hypothetical protein [Hyphomicrobiaceae bacterium]
MTEWWREDFVDLYGNLYIFGGNPGQQLRLAPLKTSNAGCNRSRDYGFSSRSADSLGPGLSPRWLRKRHAGFQPAPREPATQITHPAPPRYRHPPGLHSPPPYNNHQKPPRPHRHSLTGQNPLYAVTAQNNPEIPFSTAPKRSPRVVSQPICDTSKTTARFHAAPGCFTQESARHNL